MSTTELSLAEQTLPRGTFDHPERLPGESAMDWAVRAIRAIPAPKPHYPETRRVALLQAIIAANAAPEITGHGMAGFGQVLDCIASARNDRKVRARKLMQALGRVTPAERKRLKFEARSAGIRERANRKIGANFAAMDSAPILMAAE